MLNVNSGFSVRGKCMRWLMATVVALWTIAGSWAMPLASAECAAMAQNSGCERGAHHAAMPHHSKNPSPNHDCCKKKPKPVRAKMPCCPEQPGSMPRTCGMSEVACCAVTSREDARRTAKPERAMDRKTQAIRQTKTLAESSPGVLDWCDRNLRDGLRYERPIFELKTDLRV